MLLLLLACTVGTADVTRADFVELVEEVYSCEEWHPGEPDANSTSITYSGPDADEHLRYPLSILACQEVSALGSEGDACEPATIDAIYRDTLSDDLTISLWSSFDECLSPAPWGTLLVRYWRIAEE